MQRLWVAAQTRLARVKSFLTRKQAGVVYIEYALLAAFIAVAITASLTNVANGIMTFFNAIATKLNNTPVP